MEELPEPQKSFAIDPVLHTLPIGTRLWRIYFRRGSHPTQWNSFRHYGPTSSRFDHHTRPKRLQSRGVIYATAGSNAIATALAETFQETRHVDRFLREPWLAGFDLTAPLSLLDTGSLWTVRAGGNMALHSGSRTRARQWYRKIYREYPDVPGIWYPSSITNQCCAALYERAAHALPSKPMYNQPLSCATLIRGISQLAAGLGYSMN